MRPKKPRKRTTRKISARKPLVEYSREFSKLPFWQQEPWLNLWERIEKASSPDEILKIQFSGSLQSLKAVNRWTEKQKKIESERYKESIKEFIYGKKPRSQK